MLLGITALIDEAKLFDSRLFQVLGIIAPIDEAKLFDSSLFQVFGNNRKNDFVSWSYKCCIDNNLCK